LSKTTLVPIVSLTGAAVLSRERLAQFDAMDKHLREEHKEGELAPIMCFVACKAVKLPALLRGIISLPHNLDLSL
jgi:hypothetical protein